MSARFPLLGIVVTACFTAYEYLTSEKWEELFTDYIEFAMGILLGLKN